MDHVETSSNLPLRRHRDNLKLHRMREGATLRLRRKGSSMKVLLSIDDSSMVHKVIRQALRDYEIEIIDALNGQEGVKMARSESPDLILLDICMPVMDGLAALREIRQIPEHARTPVVLFTSDGSMATLDVAFEEGVTMNLIKPFSAEMLTSMISALIPLERRAL